MKWQGLGWRGSMAEKFKQPVMVLRGITYLPHYTQQGLFVGPGGLIHSEQSLLMQGAIWSVGLLLARPYNNKEIEDEQLS
jgi:hypothetical protein